MSTVYRYFLLPLTAIVVSCTTTPASSLSDVEAFIQRRDICDHLRGEFPDPPDPERVKEIVDGVKEYCTGTDAQLAALKAKFEKDAAAMRKLNEYESKVESTPP